MATGSLEQRYTPLYILLLVAALVTVLGLWAVDRTGRAGEDARQLAGSPEGGKTFQ